MCTAPSPPTLARVPVDSPTVSCSWARPVCMRLMLGMDNLPCSCGADDRVVAMDRTNVRFLESLPEPVDLVTIDVSFIGLKLVLPAAKSVLKPGGRIVALVKPQFEAGREAVGRGGVVRDPAVHAQVLRQLFTTAADLSLGVLGLTASPLRGPAGNIEFLALLAPNVPSIAVDDAVVARSLSGASEMTYSKNTELFGDLRHILATRTG